MNPNCLDSKMVPKSSPLARLVMERSRTRVPRTQKMV
ncbi:unnamed protein product, partial [Pylaiella littoralis]